MTGRNIDNNGSVVVEMCIIAPILVSLVFVIINILIIMIDRSIVTGDAYVTLYSSCEYVSAGYGEYDCDAVAAEELSYMENVPFADDVNAEAEWSGGSKPAGDLFGGMTRGTMSIKTGYRAAIPGSALLIREKDMRDEVVVNREIRDTSGNLRRWQKYGKLPAE